MVPNAFFGDIKKGEAWATPSTPTDFPDWRTPEKL